MIDILAYKRAISFNEKEYHKLQEQVEENRDILKTFITNQDLFLSFNKPLAELSTLEKKTLFASPLVEEFMRINPLQRDLIFNYWEAHAIDKLSYRVFEMMELLNTRSEYSLDVPDEDTLTKKIKPFLDRSGFLNPIYSEQILEIFELTATKKSEQQLKMIQFLKKFGREYWFFFN